MRYFLICLTTGANESNLFSIRTIIKKPELIRICNPDCLTEYLLPPDESGGYVQETPTESQEKQERSVVAHQDQACYEKM